uniref:NUDIX domain-containing protein n=1 Tax=Clostridium sp. NkU-1 TaxID=1095009 RepID=UPI0006D09078
MHRIIAAAIVKEGKTLIAKRNYGSLAGYWEFPGGKVEDNETDVECLKREIMEELSVKLKIEEFLGEQQFFCR